MKILVDAAELKRQVVDASLLHAEAYIDVTDAGRLNCPDAERTTRKSSSHATSTIDL
jgi:hypothetical protein